MSTSAHTANPIGAKSILGHPPGLFLLFLVEMWERFSYYGMRGLLVLYLVTPTTDRNPGPGWSKEDAANLYGWYTGMAYLLPVFGGMIADKLIGAHRSLLIGGLVIALGHVALAVSGLSALGAHAGMSMFIFGLALIVTGTGHFKPNVSVMVGALYGPDDPRRDGAFTIFYMGINVGAFICAFVCGTLGEKVGWHWGFGAAAVGMLLGLILYVILRPRLLAGIGIAPAGKPDYTILFMIAGVVLAAAVGLLFHFGAFASVGQAIGRVTSSEGGAILFAVLKWGLLLAVVAWAIWFVRKQPPDDRGPTAAILLFILFNAVFWLAFEQAGSSLNLFAAEMTDRHIGSWEMPATWFQSVGPLLVITLAPVFAAIWSWLGKRNANPSMPTKMWLGLLLLGGGYVFMVVGSVGTTQSSRASMFWLVATYFMHTLGELCVSPTGLSFVTRAAPARYVSFLMGIWFLSNAIANKVGGQIAGQIENIEQGRLSLPWYRWFKLGGQADFFLLFVILSVGAAAVVLLLTPLLKRLLHGRG